MDLYTAFDAVDRISTSCPRAIIVFIDLLLRADSFGKITLSKAQIINDLDQSFVKFRNDLKALERENLLKLKSAGEMLHVTLNLPGKFNDGS